LKFSFHFTFLCVEDRVFVRSNGNNAHVHALKRYCTLDR
jgi:hypothetical protein